MIELRTPGGVTPPGCLAQEGPSGWRIRLDARRHRQGRQEELETLADSLFLRRAFLRRWMRRWLVEKVCLGKQQHLPGCSWQGLETRIIQNARIHILFPTGVYAMSVPTGRSGIFPQEKVAFPARCRHAGCAKVALTCAKTAAGKVLKLGRTKSHRNSPFAREKRRQTAEMTCKSAEHEDNHERCPRCAWARKQMGNPRLEVYGPLAVG
jgi:hypothetical protein